MHENDCWLIILLQLPRICARQNKRWDEYSNIESLTSIDSCSICYVCQAALVITLCKNKLNVIVYNYTSGRTRPLPSFNSYTWGSKGTPINHLLLCAAQIKCQQTNKNMTIAVLPPRLNEATESTSRISALSPYCSNGRCLISCYEATRK